MHFENHNDIKLRFSREIIYYSHICNTYIYACMHTYIHTYYHISHDSPIWTLDVFRSFLFLVLGLLQFIFKIRI